jgi:PAS domain S-box-containing protein
MDQLTALFARNGFLPHGYCFTWTPGLLWSMVVSDAAIAAAYFSIPLAIGRYVRGRSSLAHPGIAWLFSAFILACGLTHVMDIWTVWQPDYAVQVLSKALTAVVSIATAITLWPLVPRLLKQPTVEQLQQAVTALEAEVGRRRTAEQHLHEVEQTLAVTLGSIGAGFISTDAQGRVVRMNAVAERLTGWPQAQALGQRLWDVFDREERPGALLTQNPVTVLQDQGLLPGTVLEAVVIARDGSRAAVEVQAALNRSDDGEVRGMTVVLRDVTQLREARAELQRMAAIVASSTDAIISKTLDGRITGWNGAAHAMFGYTAAEIIGQPVQRLIPLELEAQEMRILANLAHGQTVPAFDTVRRAKDGRLIEVSITISPIRDATGRIVGGSKIARDITSQRLAAQARQRATALEIENRQIHEANRLKSLFLANMSHELRTPLNAIIGFSELLHAGAVPPGSPRHQQFLDHIGTSGRHLLQLINDVLDLSKVESGKFEFFPEPLSLRRLVGDVANVLMTSVQRKHLRLHLDIDDSVDALVLDPARLKQVLFNLLSNALKFTGEGGEVTVRARPEGADWLRIEVADTGIGIAADDLPRLFVEFQQLDTGFNKRHQGTGLGLALTRRLVQAQGGSVGVHSTPGRGSTFHVVLPRRQPPPLPPASAPLPLSRRLLVIEHDAAARTRLVSALADTGYAVDSAGTGDEAQRQARLQAYDAITLDFQLPDQTGLDTLSQIRSGGPSHDAPVVGVTLAAATGAAARFAIANVLSKPIRTGEVVSAMARLALPSDRRARVLVIDDEPVALELMAATLGAIAIDTIGRSSGRAALAELATLQPDAIVLDLMMPEMDGFAVLDALQRRDDARHIPVLIWTSLLLTEDEYRRLSRSAQAIVGKGGGLFEQMLALMRAQVDRSVAAEPDANTGTDTDRSRA